MYQDGPTVRCSEYVTSTPTVPHALTCIRTDQLSGEYVTSTPTVPHALTCIRTDQLSGVVNMLLSYQLSYVCWHVLGHMVSLLHEVCRTHNFGMSFYNPILLFGQEIPMLVQCMWIEKTRLWIKCLWPQTTCTYIIWRVYIGVSHFIKVCESTVCESNVYDLKLLVHTLSHEFI